MLRRLALAGLISIGALGPSGAVALAAHDQVAMIEDDAIVSNPAVAVPVARELGADEVRVFMLWNRVAPSPDARRPPRGFNGADPAAYAPSAWAPWDAAIREAQAEGIRVDLNVAGGAPRWASGPGMPGGGPHPSWEPDPVAFGAFVRAVGKRYSGNYDPVTGTVSPGNPDDLPAVDFWSVWNEPNFGTSLAPQGHPGQLKIEYSPWQYRRLLDAGWSSLQATGHRGDTILFGELAPHGFEAVSRPGMPRWGLFGSMKPLHFLRSLYCLDANYRQLRGSAATIRGCPATAGGSRRFRQAHPALFEAEGFAVHPYSRWYPPNIELNNDPDYASLADIGAVFRALDRVQRAYGSHRRLPVWNTEYGYLTSPPKRSTAKIPFISPTTAAAYINQAEYMSWRNPRIMSFMQYLLTDPVRPTRANDFGGYASGLMTWNGMPKPTFDAWRLPLYLPVSTTKPGRALEVWGCVRPAYFALQDFPTAPEMVQIQFTPRYGGAFTTVASEPITDAYGYFDTRVRFPGSGYVRTAWSQPPSDVSQPPGASIYSRTAPITVR